MTTPTALEAADLSAEFARHAGGTGPAIVHNGRTIAYRELADRVDALAEGLGPDPGTVAVLTSRTPETVVALLAILAAGGTYCPVDPAFPAVRRDAMLAAAGCRSVVVTAPGQTPPPGLLAVDAAAPPPSRGGRTAPAGPGRPAYVLFTSGSTGVPKPVATPRGAIAATVASLRDLFGVTADDRVLQFASLNWDTCFEEILPALTGGATLVLDDEAHTGSFPRFLRAIAERGVTVADLPTAYWHELVHHLTDYGDPLPDCLRLLIIGGEAASPARLADWHRLETGGVRLLNTYGCTETTLITHAAELGAEVDGRVPIGHALPHVVEEIGADGELLIGGPALALGYLGLPEETAARFAELPDGRFFRTGDRVVRAGDAGLLHMGRIDGELKIRGVRVDPAEVEALIGAHPAVAAVAAVGATVAGRTLLVAYVVASGDDPEDLPGEVLGHLRTTVPGHLVPGRLTVVGELAYTASGKVDRAATHRRYAREGREARR
ncbi:amino acid adenylation domain-containing protein [Phytomonospora sp. NPDC050363]|uniref:amino acid adenylation domain-containing protein n=1 Tax=Phytomonospora sp. NPDC050363 TaxID=3155642 RepID=UPI0033D8164A